MSFGRLSQNRPDQPQLNSSSGMEYADREFAYAEETIKKRDDRTKKSETLSRKQKGQQ